MHQSVVESLSSGLPHKIPLTQVSSIAQTSTPAKSVHFGPLDAGLSDSLVVNPPRESRDRSLQDLTMNGHSVLTGNVTITAQL